MRGGVSDTSTAREHGRGIAAHLRPDRSGSAGVVAADRLKGCGWGRRRVELQAVQLQQSAAKLQGQAQQALAAGHDVDDELARMKAQLTASARPAIEGTETEVAGQPTPPGQPAAS